MVHHLATWQGAWETKAGLDSAYLTFKREVWGDSPTGVFALIESWLGCIA